MEASIQIILFWLFAILGIAGGIGLLLNRSPVYAALSLIINFFSIAGLYLSLQAEFLAVIQVLVYAGAIMVLFLFVIMLLNLTDEKGVLKFSVARGAAFILGLGLIVELLFVLKGFSGSELSNRFGENFAFGEVEPIGRELMTNYLLPFEMISVILLAALIGAIVVAKKYTYK